MNPEDKIKITYFNLISDQNSSVIALFGCQEVKRDFYMAKLKLIQKKSGEVFIAFPSEKYTDPKTGQDAYSNFCWYGPKNSDEFQKTALESIKSYCARKGIAHPALIDCKPKEVANQAYGSTVPYPNPTFSGATHA
jgi:hypothetical protein